MAQLPPLPWLRAFEAAARHLSFTHAAAELHLTQAAVSKQVRLLEQALGAPLFERGPRSLTLTKVGAAYVPKLRDAFARLAEGTEEVFGTRRARVLTVRVATSFAVTWLAPRLPRWRDAHPGRALRLVSSVWNEGSDKDRYDLDIRYGTGPWPGFRSDRLTWEVLEPLCLPDLVTTPEDIAGQCLLHVLGYEEGWGRWLATAGVSAQGPGLQVDTSLMAFALAEAGVGVALGRSSMTTGALAGGRLVRPLDLGVPVAEAFHLLLPEAGGAHPDAGAFRAWLLSEAEADPVNVVNRGG
ncbi:MAG: LysR family transcriptional regulator [Limimaricola sp.]|uniref:LysR substrate-binding domain-containing protein n=1 Tax=Limimaricola sp. TaxID=2211665 RepID=UPI001E09E78B|nr:LysR substrate-binding domain-containing protein [Limimaricola sp.]MBI1418606.1 LysR family transcriptional regulator [Limimaricola sp.]